MLTQTSTYMLGFATTAVIIRLVHTHTKTHIHASPCNHGREDTPDHANTCNRAYMNCLAEKKMSTGITRAYTYFVTRMHVSPSKSQSQLRLIHVHTYAHTYMA